MKLKRFLSMILCSIAIAISCFPIASAAVARSYPQTAHADKDTGVTTTFEIHKDGRVRFYVWNEDGLEDLTITVHKKNLFGWSDALTVNGSSEFLVSAGENAFFDTDGVDWEKGTYRFEAESQAAYDFVYEVDVRELDYTP